MMISILSILPYLSFDLCWRLRHLDDPDLVALGVQRLREDTDARDLVLVHRDLAAGRLDRRHRLVDRVDRDRVDRLARLARLASRDPTVDARLALAGAGHPILHRAVPLLEGPAEHLAVE